MSRRSLALGDQRVGRFLDAIVEECVGVLKAEDEPRTDRLPEIRVDLLLWSALYHGQGWDPGNVSQAGEAFECFPCSLGQALQLADH